MPVASIRPPKTVQPAHPANAQEDKARF